MLPYEKIKNLSICLLIMAAGTIYGDWGPNTNRGNNNNINNNNVLVNFSIIPEFMEAAYHRFHDQTKNFTNNLQASFSLLTQISTDLALLHKWKLLFLAAAGSYGYIVRYNTTLKNYLLDTSRWYLWTIQNIGQAGFTEENFNRISQELIREIQGRYFDQQTPEDFVTPLIRFLKEINLEIYYLQQYQRINRFAEKTGVHTYIFFDTEINERTKLWLHYAELLKSIFLRWMADFKMQQQIHRTFIASL